MASKFTALPLTSGEAFLLTTDHGGRTWTILVDSGQRTVGQVHPLMEAIHAVEPDLKRIDVAICTHQDADHAAGFKNFADAWCGGGGKIGEYWLPGRWSAAFPNLIQEPSRIVRAVVKGAEQFAREIQEADGGEPIDPERRAIIKEKLRSERYLRMVSDAFRAALPEGNERNDQQDMPPQTRLANALGLSVESLESIRASIKDEGSEDYYYRYLRHCYLEKMFMYRFDAAANLTIYLSYMAMNSVASIAAIVKNAILWSIPIRWFDFGLFETGHDPSGGLQDLLEPVNAVQLRRPPPTVSDQVLFLSLHLTRQNVESLVFLRPENEQEPAVLFLGDSRLSFGISRPTANFRMPAQPNRPPLITAPHHGSEKNDNAYQVIDSWLGLEKDTALFVRNGGQINQKLGQFLTKTNRRCAQCVQCNGPNWKQPVSVVSAGNQWGWPPRYLQNCSTPAP
jgi:hypothetical protein